MKNKPQSFCIITYASISTCYNYYWGFSGQFTHVKKTQITTQKFNQFVVVPPLTPSIKFHHNLYIPFWVMLLTDKPMLQGGNEIQICLNQMLLYADFHCSLQGKHDSLTVFTLDNHHSTKKPVTTMLTYPWKCTVLHCNHLGNTWKPLVLMTRHFDYCPSASEGDNQSVRSSAPVVSSCFPGGYNVKL